MKAKNQINFLERINEKKQKRTDELEEEFKKFLNISEMSTAETKGFIDAFYKFYSYIERKKLPKE